MSFYVSSSSISNAKTALHHFFVKTPPLRHSPSRLLFLQPLGNFSVLERWESPHRAWSLLRLCPILSSNSSFTRAARLVTSGTTRPLRSYLVTAFIMKINAVAALSAALLAGNVHAEETKPDEASAAVPKVPTFTVGHRRASPSSRQPSELPYACAVINWKLTLCSIAHHHQGRLP